MSLVLVLLATACAGSSSSIVDSRTVDSTTVVPEHLMTPSDEPKAEASPPLLVPEHRPEAGDVGDNRPIRPEMIMPGGPGFWCVEYRRTAEQLDHFGVCYRTEQTCQNLRKNGIKRGDLATPCTRRERAHCYVIADVPEQFIHWRCYDSMEQCSAARIKFQSEERLEFEACKLSAGLAGDRPVRVSQRAR